MSLKSNKNKLLQGITIIISFILILNCSHVYASGINVESHTENFYINDFANLLTDEQEKEMMQKAIELDDSYDGIQVVLTTVSSLDGHSSQEYAYAMYNQYGIGADSMGVLILFSLEDRQVRIETGYKMQSYITDSTSGKILDKYGMDYFKADKFAEGLISVQEATITEIKSRVPNDWRKQSKTSSTHSSGGFSSFLLNALLFVVFPIGILVLIYILVMKLLHKKEEKQDRIINEALAKNNKKWENKVKYINQIFNDEKKELNEMLSSKNQEISMLKGRNTTLEDKIDKMTQKEEYILKIHPNIDDEISQKVEEEYKEEAQQYDYTFIPLLDIKPKNNNELVFKNGIDEYEALCDGAKKYSKMDILNLKNMYNTSKELRIKHEEEEARQKDIKVSNEALKKIKDFVDSSPKPDHNHYLEIATIFAIYMGLSKAQKSYISENNAISSLLRLNEKSKQDYDNYTLAKEVEASLNHTIDRVGIADRDNIDEIKKAISKYEHLSNAQKAYVSIAIYNKLKNLLKRAEDDEDDYKRRKKREEEQRRASLTSSRTNVFGGHGGHSGGGGAGRSF